MHMNQAPANINYISDISPSQTVASIPGDKEESLKNSPEMCPAHASELQLVSLDHTVVTAVPSGILHQLLYIVATHQGLSQHLSSLSFGQAVY